jgi:hypothetical protein
METSPHLFDAVTSHLKKVVSLFSNQPAFDEYRIRLELLQVVKQHNIRPQTRSYRPSVEKTETLGGIETCHLYGDNRINACSDENSQVLIQMALLKNGLRLTIITAKQAAPAIGSGDAFEQMSQLVACRTLSQQYVHAAIDTIVHLLDGGTLMVGVDQG